MSCLHARGISDLPMGNGPGLQHLCPMLVRAPIDDIVAGLTGSYNVMTKCQSTHACVAAVR